MAWDSVCFQLKRVRKSPIIRLESQLTGEAQIAVVSGSNGSTSCWLTWVTVVMTSALALQT